MSVCMFVPLISQKPQTNLQQFFVHVAHSRRSVSTNGFVIRCVLPVLWWRHVLHNGPYSICHVDFYKRQKDSVTVKSTSLIILTKFCSSRKTNYLHTYHYASHWGRSLPSTISPVFLWFTHHSAAAEQTCWRNRSKISSTRRRPAAAWTRPPAQHDIHADPKNWYHFYVSTLSNTNRFSKLFHCQNLNQEKICNKTTTKDPITSQVCRYTTLWNVTEWANCRSVSLVSGVASLCASSSSKVDTLNIWLKTAGCDIYFRR